MKSKSLMLFAVAAGCGLVAMIGAQRMMAANRTHPGETVKVLVARTDIAPGIRLDAESVTFKALPAEAVPEGAVLEEAQYKERALKSRAFAGQPILVQQLGEKGVFGTSVQLRKGYRLHSVPVNATQIHSGLMKPGDRVDIVLAYEMNRPGIGTQSFARTILKYVEVFAMGDQQIGAEANDGKQANRDVKNVTVQVTPAEGELLQLAQKKGTLALALRGIDDTEDVNSQGMDESQLADMRAELNDERPREPEPPPIVAEPKPTFGDYLKGMPVEVATPATKPTWKMEVFQGDERKVYELELPEDAAPSPPNDTAVTSSPSLMNSMKTFWLGGAKKRNMAP